MKDDHIFSKLEDELNFDKNGRRPQFLGKGKTIYFFWKIKDDLNINPPLPLLNTKPNPPILGLCTAQLRVLYLHLTTALFLSVSRTHISHVGG